MDKYTAQKKYAKKHIKNIGCSFQAEFVDAFKEACAKLGVTQSEIIKKAMQDTIDKTK